MAVMGIAHHHCHVWLLEPDVARPAALESDRVVDIEIEVSAGPQCSCNGFHNPAEVRLAWNMVERVVFARNQVYSLWQTKAPHVGSQ
jgi:hypothetical protein